MEREVPNNINDFFSSIESKLADKLKEPWYFRGMVSKEECQPISTDFEQVLDLCKQINATKSSGIRDIASKILKHAFFHCTKYHDLQGSIY